MIINTNKDKTSFLTSKIQQAVHAQQALNIVAGNSKAFYGRTIDCKNLNISTHSGIINYEPSELVMTVRSGTKLTEINLELNKNNQMLAFEPPQFNANTTIGGSIACGLSGSRRPFFGSARDFILGCRIINGKGENLRFGGEVIKNVAGYDASRLMTGALGTLGVILDVSIKVLPKPESELTLVQTLSTEAALKLMLHLKRQAFPISGLCFYSNHLFIRLSGSKKTLDKTQAIIGGELLTNTFIESELSFSWQQLDNHSLDFFNTNKNLWRISVKPNTPALNIKDDCIYGWAGAERWITSDKDNKTMLELASKAKGHATLFRVTNENTNKTNNTKFQPLSTSLLTLHKELKKSFDPYNILNPGKLYSEI
ncbi:Glycolate dehydrogenase, FAD-binding subunit GlcE [hydrothermal vent metagenome]|uniref:Glycolate dehydrogenase, FAD-binding subunit GlcE n=1 Tax=hydrothermal vent metagenome TaxID=652676 RepID=A0A3B1AKJ3_9ZZZZ